MVTDAELDRAVWDAPADGSISPTEFEAIIEQAKVANHLLAALRSIANEFVEGKWQTYGDVTAAIDRIRETARVALAKAEGKP